MHREFREWVDFGADGRAPESVSIDYRPDAMASVVEDQSERIDRLWESAKRERPACSTPPAFDSWKRRIPESWSGRRSSNSTSYADCCSPIPSKRRRPG